MEAVLCRKLGDPTTEDKSNSPIVLIKSHPIPQVDSPTAVRVRVKATSLNYANYLQILGNYQEKPPLPFIPGSDYSGIVDAVGPNVSQFQVGDPVCSIANLGSFAQFIVVDQSQLYVTLSFLVFFNKVCNYYYYIKFFVNWNWELKVPSTRGM